MPAEKFTTKIMAQEVILAHSATTKAGAPYSIYQVRATRADGTQILWPDGSGEIPLRTFDENFPTNELVEVEAVLFKSERYGNSYTVSVKGKQGGQTAKKVKAIDDEMSSLRERVAKLEQVVGEILRDERPANGAPAPPPSAPPPPPQVNQQAQTFDPVKGSMSGPQSADPPPF